MQLWENFKLYFRFRRINFKPKPDNHCRLSKLSLAKRSELFGQLLTSLCRVLFSRSAFIPLSLSLFLSLSASLSSRRFVAAKLCNVSAAAFGAHPLPPSWSCSSCCGYSPFHFILHILLWLPLARQLIHFLLLCLLISMWQIYSRTTACASAKDPRANPNSAP